MTRKAMMWTALIGLAIAWLIIPTWLSSLSRESSVNASRAACNRSADNYANDTNQLRGMIQYIKVTGPRHPTVTQKTAQTRVITNDLKSIDEKLDKIDVKDYRLLQSPIDQSTVRYGPVRIVNDKIVRGPVFTCINAFPPVSLLP